MRMYDLILKKRQGNVLTKDEIDWMIREYTDGRIPDYQMSAMMMAICFQGLDKEETYDKIYDGKWLSNGDYAVIHRIAVDNTYKGLGLSHKIIKYTEDKCKENNVHSIKVDTHEENIPMQKLLTKNGFEYCGIIYLEDGGKRVAFEKNF